MRRVGAWLEASGIEEGPLFRRVGVDRRRVRASDSETALARTTYSIGTAPLTRQGVNGIYRRVALAAFELGLVSLPASELTAAVQALRSEEHTSELQSLMRLSYAVFCLKKKKKTKNVS